MIRSENIRVLQAVRYQTNSPTRRDRGAAISAVLFILQIAAIQSVAAQTDTAGDSSSVKLRGSALLSAEAYHGASSDLSFRPRLQPYVARAIIRAELSLPCDVVLPFELYASSQNVTFQQPFNQLGVNPRFGSALTLHAGFFPVAQSDFTFGDMRIFGGGFDFTPGDFRLSAGYGSGRFAREPIAEAAYPGEYSRRFFLAAAGYGKLTGDNINLNISYATDDTTTVSAPDSIRPAPQENLAASITFAISPTEQLAFSGEAGAAIFTNDTRLPTIDSTFRLPEFLVIKPRVSTQVDGAARLTASYSPTKEFTLKSEAKWVGPGFVTLGWQALQNDVLDITLAPSARLAEGRIIVRAAAGVRFNNLRNNRFSTTRRTIGSAFIGWQITPTLGVDAQYGNYGMRSAHLNDTLRIQNVFQNFTISPRYSFDWLGGVNTVTANYSLQDVDDKNVFSQQFTRSVAHTLLAAHTISLPSTLNITTSALFNSFSAAGLTTQVGSFTISAGKSTLDDALNVTLTGGINIIITLATDRQITAGFASTYVAPALGVFTLNASINSFVAAQLVQSPSFSELTGSLSYRVTF